jgi:hypothetical protein
MKRYCSYCNAELKRSKIAKNVFCNARCKGNWQKENLKGEKNPMFRHEYSDEYKKRRSELTKKQMENPNQRYLAGTANRGKTFDAERRLIMSQGMQGHIGVMHTDDTKDIIGKKSSAKFTDEYKERMRKQNYAAGIWIDPLVKNEYKLYCEFANWQQRMFDIVSEGIDKLNAYGVFHMKHNVKGVVRDHMYGRKSGFDNGVFPEILRHPANCQIIQHGDNVSKNFKKKECRDSIITVDQLFERILTWENYWHEQENCVDLIYRYQHGERYDKIYYIK